MKGLAQFRKDLKAIDAGLAKQLTKYLRESANKTKKKAQGLAPVGKPYQRDGKQHRPGTLKRSIKSSVKARQMSLYSDLVYAPAHEWGANGQMNSRIRPKGVPIRIRDSQMLGRAVFSRIDEFEKELLEMVDHLARINGFND